MIELFNTFNVILFTVLGSASLILIFYWILLFRIKKQIPKKSSFTPPISVIIAARNEKDNLIKNLPHLLNQDYLNFEIIVVNNGSFDGSKEALDAMMLQYSNLKVVQIELKEQYKKGKKFALTLGIKAAQHEHLLFTDADCSPVSNQWITSMANQFEKHDVVVGIAPLRTNNSILGACISYETFHTANQYIGYTQRNLIYMGVGRNMGYTKSVFFKNKGFANHQHIMSGDDDLFIQEVAQFSKVIACIDTQSLVYSDGPRSVVSWFKQKIRHLSTGSFYVLKFKFLLGFYALIQMLWLISGVLLFVLFPPLWYVTLSIILIKWFVQWIIMGPFALHIQHKKIAYFLPYYDILFTIYLLFFGVIRIFIKPKTWN